MVRDGDINEGGDSRVRGGDCSVRCEYFSVRYGGCRVMGTSVWGCGQQGDGGQQCGGEDSKVRGEWWGLQ